MADFALLEGKDWREEFTRSSCDISKLKVQPQPKKIILDTFLKELENYMQLALSVATNPSTYKL